MLSIRLVGVALLEFSDRTMFSACLKFFNHQLYSAAMLENTVNCLGGRIQHSSSVVENVLLHK